MTAAAQLSPIDLMAMGIYLIAVIALGLFFSRKEKTTEDYLLGGRNMPWLAVGISCLMSLLSTYSLVMVPGEIYNHGLSLWMLNLIYPLLSVGAVFLFIRFYFRINAFTPFEYLERRYNKSIRALISIIYLWARLLYLAMVLYATSKVFEGGAGWPAWATILGVGIIGIIYTVMGGMKAVIWTDVLQFFVLVGGLAVAVIILCYHVDGGFIGAISYALDHGRGPTEYANPQFYTLDPYMRLTFWLILFHLITQALFNAGADQITVQRLLSTKSYQDAKKSVFTQACLSLPFTMILWFIGLAIFSFYSQHPDPQVTSGDTAFFTFVSTMLPPPIPGLILAAMLAAVMSTLDSGMNSLSAVWVKEIHLKFINPETSEKDQVRLSKWATAGVGVFTIGMGTIIATTSETLNQSVVEAVVVFGALGVVILPAFLLAVTSERITSKAIWLLAPLCWGMNFGTVTWYITSKRGLTGPVSATWVICSLSCIILFFTIGALRRMKGGKKTLWIALSLFPTGYTAVMIGWYIISHTHPDGGILSFKWVGIPGFFTFMILGYLSTLFTARVDPVKYQGLTLWTMKEKHHAE